MLNVQNKNSSYFVEWCFTQTILQRSRSSLSHLRSSTSSPDHRSQGCQKESAVYKGSFSKTAFVPYKGTLVWRITSVVCRSPTAQGSPTTSRSEAQNVPVSGQNDSGLQGPKGRKAAAVSGQCLAYSKSLLACRPQEALVIPRPACATSRRRVSRWPLPLPVREPWPLGKVP